MATPMTMTQKILAAHAGRADVRPGENVWVDVPEGEEYRRTVEPHENEDGETLYVAYKEASVGSRGAFHVSYLEESLENRYGWYCSVCESFDNAMDPSGRVVCNDCGNVRKPTRWDAAYL